MVRSNSETPQNLLRLAERFRSAKKYIDVSLAEIERRLDGSGGEYEYRSEVEVRDEDGEPVAAELRININCSSAIWRSWSVSIKLHKVRIDGIDHESRFPIGDGKFGSGWHRHTWDAKVGNADNKERGKLMLDHFADRILGRTAFLVRAFAELSVVVNKVDYGTDELFDS